MTDLPALPETEEQWACYTLLCSPFCFGRPGRKALLEWLWMSDHVSYMGFLETYRIIAGLEHVHDDLLAVVVEAVQSNYNPVHDPVTLPALIEDCRKAQAKLDRIHELNQLRKSFGLDDHGDPKH
jgi:hypothetical protein